MATNRRQSGGAPLPVRPVAAAVAVLAGLALVALAWAFTATKRRPEPALPPAAERQGQLAEQVALRAQSLLSQRRPGEAIELMEEYVKTVPLDVRLRPLLAEVYLQQDQPDRAAGVAQTILKLDPTHRLAHWVKGEALRRRGDEAFQGHLHQAVEGLAPADVLARTGGSFLLAERFDQAVDCFDRALGLEPNLSAALVGRARIHQVRGEHARQIRLLERLMALEPANALWHEELARAELARGELAAAERACRESAELSRRQGKPPSPTAMLTLSEVYRRMAMEAALSSERRHFAGRAMELARAAVQLPGAQVQAHCQAALVLGMLGGPDELEQAGEHVAQALHIEPSNPVALDLQQRLAAARRGLPAGALRFQEPALPEPPPDPTSQPDLRFRLR